MTAQYFSHDINAQHDDKCVALLTTLGWKGYGVFWGIVERMHERPGCRLAYNPKGLAWSLHVTEKFLIRVITEFNLFIFSEDGTEFWSESAVRRQEMRSKRYASKSTKGNADETDTCLESQKETDEKPKRKRGRPRKHPLPEPIINAGDISKTANEPAADSAVAIYEIGARTPKATEVPEAPQTEEEKTNDGAQNHTFYSEWREDVKGEEVKPLPAEDIIALWNEKFVGTRQTYRGLYLDSVSLQRAYETLSSGYTLNDLERAFQVARNDNFNWLLKDVLKKDNVQRLLVKGDKQNERTNYTGSSGTGDTSSSGADWLPSDWQQYVHGDEQ